MVTHGCLTLRLVILLLVLILGLLFVRQRVYAEPLSLLFVRQCPHESWLLLAHTAPYLQDSILGDPLETSGKFNSG